MMHQEPAEDTRAAGPLLSDITRVHKPEGRAGAQSLDIMSQFAPPAAGIGRRSTKRF
jgi:hypothetical protein